MDRNSPAAGVADTLVDREAELSELAANLQSIAESERILLARQLHDELGGALVGAKMDLSWLRRKIGSTDPDVIARWDRLERALETGIAFKRRVVEQLRPTLLDNLGFYPAARWLTEEMCNPANLKFELELSTPEPELSKDAGIALFRVLQESLTNTIRHSKAKLITISARLDANGRSVRLVIVDNGIGVSPERLRSLGGHGLGSMRHRILALGGEFAINSKLGQGTEVSALVPIAHSAA